MQLDFQREKVSTIDSVFIVVTKLQLYNIDHSASASVLLVLLSYIQRRLLRNEVTMVKLFFDLML